MQEGQKPRPLQEKGRTRAGEGDQQIVGAVDAADASEAVGEHTASKERAQLALAERGQSSKIGALFFALRHQCRDVALDDGVQRCGLGTTRDIAGRERGEDVGRGAEVHVGSPLLLGIVAPGAWLDAAG